jgi:hypothetical protein
MGAAPPALIGRGDEIATLRASLEDAAAGRGSLLLASGEPGIGKTRLLEEAARLAASFASGEVELGSTEPIAGGSEPVRGFRGQRGFAVAWGRAWEAGGAPEYWPWIQILRTLQRVVGGEVGRLAVELAGGGSSESDRFALFDRVVGALGDAAAGRPLLVLLDDLHAADPSSLRLLELLASQLGELRVVVAASFRDVEARLSPEVGDRLARIARRGRSLPLGRLGPSDVAALVRETGTLPDDRAVVEMVHAATEGNPLFVGELVRLIASRTNVPPGGRLPVPDGVRAVMRERLRLLGAECLPLLEVAAVIGREFNVALLAGAAAADAAAIPSRLARALASGLVEERGPGHYAFSHALVGETLATDLDPGRRSALHRAVAGALERRHAGDPAGPLAEIAHHYLEAGASAADVAVAAAVRAAERAMRGLAFEDAAALLERALGAEALVTPPDGQRRAELLLALGEACLRAGSSERGKQACREAVVLGREHGSSALVARAALTYGIEFSFAVVDRVLVGLLEGALAMLPPEDSPLRARVMARLSGAMQPAADPSVPMRVAREAIAMARRLGDGHGEVRLDVLHTAGSALVDYAPPEERIALSREVIALATAPRDRPRAVRARLRLVFDHLELGDLAGVETATRAYEAAVEEFPQPRYRWPSLLLQAMRALLEGRFAEDRRLLDEAETLAERARDPNLGRAMKAHRLIAARLAGAEAEARVAAESHLETIKAAMGPSISRLHHLWVILLSAESRAELATALGAFTHDELVTACQDFNLACFLAEVVAILGDRALAERLTPALAPRAGRLCVATMLGFAVQDLGDRSLLLLAATRGAWDDVERHAQDALALAERLGSSPFAARVRLDWATAVTARGRAEDRARARTLFEEALALAERVGMPELAAVCQQALAAAPGGAPTPAPFQPGARIEAVREGDTWTLSGGGEVCRVRDSRGMQMLARLLERPGEELHVLDLAGADREAVDGGDAGEVLDREARAAYQARVRELDDALAEAESWNDTGRAERARRELEALRAELARAVGLGGRERREGRAVERARVNVQRRITDALRRIQELRPNLGRYLSMTVRTGTYCAYEPFDPAARPR